MLRVRSEARDPGFDGLLFAQMKAHGLTDTVVRTAGGDLPGATTHAAAATAATPALHMRGLVLAGCSAGVLAFVACSYFLLSAEQAEPKSKETAMEQIKTPAMYQSDSTHSQQFFDRAEHVDSAATTAAASISAYQSSGYGGYSDGLDQHAWTDSMRDDQHEDI